MIYTAHVILLAKSAHLCVCVCVYIRQLSKIDQKLCRAPMIDLDESAGVVPGRGRVSFSVDETVR